MSNSVTDLALVAYPLYQTASLINDQENNNVDETRRWLYFWLVFGGFEVAEGFGADQIIPLFGVAKAATLLSMYSQEHAIIVEKLLPKVCKSFLNQCDKVKDWWHSQTIAKTSYSYFDKLMFWKSAKE